MPFPILATGADWLAIHKPAGIGIHSEQDAGLIVQLSQQLQRPLWPVHRLDKMTSGILLVATSKEGAARLGELFATQTIEKYYLAQSQQRPKKKQGWIKGDMEKGRNGSWLLKRTLNNPAITRFVSQYDDTSARRLFLLRPYTGKTHQLRVAMKSLGCPILGDARYGGDSAERGYLHAYALRWQEPAKGLDSWVEIICPPLSFATGQWPLPENWRAPWKILS